MANEDQLDLDEDGMGDVCQDVGCDESYDFEGGLILEAFALGGDFGFDIAPGTGRGGEGSALRSGPITHSQSSSVSVVLDVGEGASLTDWYKVSTENGFDFLLVDIDGDQIEAFSGEEDSTESVIELPVGVHTATWSYYKDSHTSSGEDTVWLDDISFAGACLAD